MSKKRDPGIFFKEILTEIGNIESFVSRTKNHEQLEETTIVFYAVLKSLENIGEAVKNIPEEVKKENLLQWKKISGLRDIIAHEYFGIDAEIIWDVVKNKLPELKKAVKKLTK